MSEKRVPKLRFKGFSGDWEQRKLGEVADVTKLAGFEFTKYVIYQETGKIIALRGLNVKNGNLVLDDIKYIDESDFSKLKRSKLYKNDILFTYVGTVGELAIITEDDRYYLAPNVARIRLNSDSSPIFVSQMMNDSTFYKRIILPLIATSSQPALSMENVRKFDLMIPTEPEQQKVGQFFKKIDNIIALHLRKLELLKQLKQGFLQQMFVREGEKKPVLRFAYFESDWEQCKLGELIDFTMGQSPNSENYTENPNHYILVQGNADMKNNRVVPRVWTTQITKQANKGDLILSVRAPVGEIGKTDYDVVIGRGVAALKGNDFIFQQLRKMKENGYWARYTTGSTFDSINSNDIKEALIITTNEEEQQQIGTFFQQLDNTIALHHNKLEQLQSLKKGYLKALFI